MPFHYSGYECTRASVVEGALLANDELNLWTPARAIETPLSWRRNPAYARGHGQGRSSPVMVAQPYSRGEAPWMRKQRRNWSTLLGVPLGPNHPLAHRYVPRAITYTQRTQPPIVKGIGYRFKPSKKYGMFVLCRKAPKPLALRTPSDCVKTLPSWIHIRRLVYPFFQSHRSSP